MPEIQIQGNNWAALVLVSDAPKDLYHVTVRTNGESDVDALMGAQFILNAFAEGRTAYVRVPPEVHSDTDFDTKETRHIGYARFSFKFEAGQWQTIVEPTIPIGFGNLQCKEAV